MAEQLNFYIPGRPNYIYYQGANGTTKCYRKTEERTYEGTVFEESKIDRTSTTLTQHLNTGADVWIQNSCEECQTPGGLQMISIDWIGTTVNVPRSGNTPIDIGDQFYTITPIRTHNNFALDDDSDGIPDAITGPGMQVNITVSETKSFSESFGAITPVKYGVSPPEVGYSDPLSAVGGMFEVMPHLMASVTMNADPLDPTILPGHESWDYTNSPVHLFSVSSQTFGEMLLPNDPTRVLAPAVSVSVQIIKSFEIDNPQSPDDHGRDPTSPLIVDGVEAIWTLTPGQINCSVQVDKQSTDLKIPAPVGGQAQQSEQGKTAFGAQPARNGLPEIYAGQVAVEDIWRVYDSTTETWSDVSGPGGAAVLQQTFGKGSANSWHENLPDWDGDPV